MFSRRYKKNIHLDITLNQSYESNPLRTQKLETKNTPSYLGEFTGLFPEGALLPRGGSFTKFRHDANLFSSACKNNMIQVTSTTKYNALFSLLLQEY